MINRYANKKLLDLWSDETKWQICLDIELLVIHALEKIDKIPLGIADKISHSANFNIKEIKTIENKTKHDFISFLTSVSNSIDPQFRGYLHMGLTSSDVLDSCFAIRLKKSSVIILHDIEQLMHSLKGKAFEHKYTTMVGRSHGIHAEVTTFGLKMAYFYAIFKRNKKRLEMAIEDISVCAISGPVGTYSNIDPFVETFVAEKMQLKVEEISSQIIPRDRHAHLFTTFSIIASCIEQLATEIRSLQRSEIREVEEFFHKGQKGSSAMPHKRNPVLSENLTGLARYIRSQCIPALEDIVLWHERDISHSAVERIIAPDVSQSLDFSLIRLNDIIKNLVVYPQVMLQNLNNLGGIIKSQDFMLELTAKGLSKEKSYDIIQKIAMKTWKDKGNFLQELLKDTDISKFLTKEEILQINDNDSHKLKKHVDYSFNRVFKQ